MRTMRLGLFTAVLVTTFGSVARADKFDIDVLSGGRRDVRQTLTDHCPPGLCASHSTHLEFHANFSKVEFDTTTGGSASHPSGKLSLQKEKGCGQQKSNRGRCSEDWEQRHAAPEPPHHSVPEPGTLLLIGVGVAATGLFSLKRNRAQ